MAKYLIASDFDWTLCHWTGGGVKQHDRDAIRRFREAGNKFVVITGRHYDSAVWALKEQQFSDVDLWFCSSGSMCLSSDHSILEEKRADGARLSELLTYFKETDALYAVVCVGTESYAVDIGGMELQMETISMKEAAALPYITGCHAKYRSIEEATARAEEVLARFGDMVNPLLNGDNMDLPPAGVDKAYAARHAAELLGVPEGNIYTVGDNMNDYAMVTAFHGRAMAWGAEGLRAAAEKTVNSIAEIVDELLSREVE